MDVAGGLFVAGSVNIGMLLLAASALRDTPGTDTIEGAHAAISGALGPAVATVFAIGLLASGLASTAVGSAAGAEIMAGLLHIRIRPFIRRVVVMIPALILLAVGVDPTFALVLSQVVLSMCIPFAVVPLVRLTSDPAVMGGMRNALPVTAAAWLTAGLIVALNGALVWLTATGS